MAEVDVIASSVMRRLEPFWPLIFASIYAYFLAFIMPLDVFKDREHYLDYATEPGLSMLDYWLQGFLPVLFNEPLFLIVNYVPGLFLSGPAVLEALIFSFSFLGAYCVLSSNPRLLVWMVLILLLPQVLKNYVMQLRQGYALSLFLYGWFFCRGVNRWLVIAMAPFLHASFFIVLAFMVAYQSFTFLRIRYWLVPLLIGAIAASSTFLIIEVASLLGVRQGERYANAVVHVSGKAFVFWFVVFCIFMAQSKSWVVRHGLEISFVAMYLGLYFMSPLAGRVFESVLPLVLIAGLSLQGRSFLIFASMFLIYFFGHYFLASREVLFGVGVAL
ncbi:hypothetical protein KUV78_03780 [Marinobacter hydrocarbonoclasticus]|uniref:hypothetical protein n=1 Tax=Marinobacter nauticus TaxID=2743 RepID=UPI001C97A2D4|nr:hypothetical protein [Marinobacter nauticus]MBY6192910.1 hypothetical protein [Marinobacter nauticus]MBY6214058.1 hypothetical protein [Marinobacter nauticus]